MRIITLGRTSRTSIANPFRLVQGRILVQMFPQHSEPRSFLMSPSWWEGPWCRNRVHRFVRDHCTLQRLFGRRSDLLGPALGGRSKRIPDRMRGYGREGNCDFVAISLVTAPLCPPVPVRQALFVRLTQAVSGKC
jgi:hypothetical protein